MRDATAPRERHGLRARGSVGITHAVAMLCATLALMLPLVLAPRSAAAQGTAGAARDSARAADLRGDLAAALVWYDRALTANPADSLALRESARLLSASGRWKDAMPRLARLVGQGATDPQVLHDYGLWLTWSGQVDSGTVLLRRAVTARPDSTEWALALAQSLTWSPPTRGEGIRRLRELEQRRPGDVGVARALASALSWNPSSRDEASQRFERLLRDNPAATGIRLDYADMLSWVGPTRPRALSLYLGVPRDDSLALRAALGRLNVLSWTNRPREAVRLADSLLLAAPGDADIARKRGLLLAAAGRPRDAVRVLDSLLRASPGDREVAEQLAYALQTTGDRRRARQVALALPEGLAPGAPDWIRRGTGVAVGLDGVYSSTSLNLRTARAILSFSAPVVGGGRLALAGGPITFDAPDGTFTASQATVSLSQPVQGLRELRVEAGVEQYPNAPTAWTSRVEASRTVHREGLLRVALRRSAVEDSRRAANGDSLDGLFIGQVRANALDVGLRVPSLFGGVGLQVSGSLGAYTGRNLRTNVRREFNASLLRAQPVRGTAIEAGLGVSLLSFAFDANRFGPEVPRDERGAYWSPTGFGNAALTLGSSLPLTGRVTLRVDAAGGYQFAGRVPGYQAFNLSGAADLRGTLRRGWDAGAGYFYLDNLGGFRLQQWRAFLRKSF